MLSLAACLLLASILGIVRNHVSPCKPKVQDELIKDFCSCVERVSKQARGTNQRILPQLCDFVNMTSKGKCTVMKKALGFYRCYLGKSFKKLSLSEEIKKDLSNIENYIHKINVNTNCRQCKPSKDPAAEKIKKQLKKQKRMLKSGE